MAIFSSHQGYVFRPLRDITGGREAGIFISSPRPDKICMSTAFPEPDTAGLLAVISVSTKPKSRTYIISFPQQVFIQFTSTVESSPLNAVQYNGRKVRCRYLPDFFSCLHLTLLSHYTRTSANTFGKTAFFKSYGTEDCGHTPRGRIRQFLISAVQVPAALLQRSRKMLAKQLL